MGTEGQECTSTERPWGQSQTLWGRFSVGPVTFTQSTCSTPPWPWLGTCGLVPYQCPCAWDSSRCSSWLLPPSSRCSSWLRASAPCLTLSECCTLGQMAELCKARLRQEFLIFMLA